MVKLTLEYDPNDLYDDKLHKCLILFNDDKYKTDIFNSIYDEQCVHVLKYLYNEIKNIQRRKIFSCKVYSCIDVLLPRKPISLTYVEEELTSDDLYFDINSYQNIIIQLELFYNLYLDLKIEYLENGYSQNVNHIFICSDDFKHICKTDDIPNTRFNMNIDNIHIHYIPTLNKSFVIDDYSLQR